MLVCVNEWKLFVYKNNKLCTFPFMSTTVYDNISYTSVVGMY